MAIFAAQMAAFLRTAYLSLPVYVRRLIWLSLLLHIVAAWFSVGYYHPDEHYQILEFAAYKAGMGPASDLPWEFAAECRPALQPFMAWGALMLLKSAGPLWISFFLRLFAAVLGWFSTFIFSFVALRWVQKPELKKWVLIVASFLWFLPFIHCRFSAESLGGSFFFLALALQLGMSRRQGINLILCGIGYGMAYVFRLQMIIILGALLLWMLFAHKYTFRQYVLMGVGFLLPFLLNFLLSKWLYGHYVFADWNYVKVNILEGKAAQFGTMPVWGYFQLIWSLGKWLNIILLLLVILAWIRMPRNPLTWTGIAFLVAHSLIGHKELRFLWPYVNAMPLLLVCGFAALYDLYCKYRRISKAALIILCFANAVALLQTILSPAKQEVILLNYLASRPHSQPLPLVTVGDSSIFMEAGILHLNYYHADKYNTYPLNNMEEASQLFSSLDSGYFIYNRGERIPPDVKAHYPELHLAYQYFPLWIDKLDFNEWVERTTLYDIYTFNTTGP
jgi:phosphatidylinositol glycan class B